MTQNILIGGLLAGSYLLGSLPFGLWVAKKLKGVDIRMVGSGNIGSTNVGRICGPKAGAFVFVLDVLKGLIPPLVAASWHLGATWQVLAALVALLGHNYSIWLGFKGGKGIATSLGALLGVAPFVGIAAGLFWVVLIVAFRIVSVASIAAALSLLPLMQVFYPGDRLRLGFGTLACVMAVYKHRANIKRLREGTEPKINLPWTKRDDTAVVSSAAIPPLPAEKDAPADVRR